MPGVLAELDGVGFWPLLSAKQYKNEASQIRLAASG